jgi:hypothetical protein
VFGVVLLTFAWPTLQGRTISVVPSFQTATYPWAAQPRGLAFMWSQSDSAESAFPWAVLARRTWRSGDLPLWDPHSFGGGVPWSTDGVAATLYPVRAVLDALFLPWLAHDLFVLVHLALAGAGAYWLARRWGGGQVAGTVAGVGWMSSAYVWGWAPLEMVTPFFAWLPLALAATDRAVRTPSRASTAIAGVVVALGMVAGNLVYALIMAATCGLLLVGLLVCRLVAARRLRDRETGRALLGGAGALALGLALAAAILVPTLVNLARISRQPFTFDVLRAGLLVPWEAYARLVERPETPPTAEQLGLMLYLTPAVAVLAVAGLLLARGAGGWSARLLVALPVLIASTVQGAWVAFHLFPGFDAIKPYGRFLPVALLGVFVLAGLGAERAWSLGTSRLRHRPPAWTAALAGALLLAGVFVPAHAVSRTVVPPPTEVTDYPLFPGTPLVRAVRADGAADGDDWPQRVLPIVPTFDTDPPTTGALMLIGGTALVPGLDTWGGYASAVPEATSDLLRLVGGEDDAAVLGEAPGPDITHPVYTSAAVDWALACRMGTDLVAMSPLPPDVRVDWGDLERRGLERAYSGPDGQLIRMPDGCATGPRLATDPVVAGSDTETVDLLRSQGEDALAGRGDAGVVVLPGSADSDTSASGAAGEIRSSARDGNTARVDVTVDGPQWLVMPMAYDEGWSATVDGADVAITQVDLNRVGVPLEAGEHRVELSYAPPGWTTGRLVSFVALVVLVGLLLPVPRLRNRGSTA